jgi:hypothetical protein
VKSSITSRSSPLGFVSAPSADHCRPRERRVAHCRTSFGAYRALSAVSSRGISKNFGPAGISSHSTSLWIRLCGNCSHLSCGGPLRPQARPLPNRCTRTTQSVLVSCTSRPARQAAQTRCCPQRAQALLLLLKSLRSLFFRKGRWGRAVPHPVSEPRKTWVSLIPISFQDGLRRSTVVVRQPVRSSGRVRARASVGGDHMGWSR